MTINSFGHLVCLLLFGDNGIISIIEKHNNIDKIEDQMTNNKMNSKKLIRILTATTFVGIFMISTISCDKKTAENDSEVDNNKAEITEQENAQSNSTTTKIELTYELSDIPFDLNGKPVEISGIKFTPATQWTDFGPSGMRTASYAFGPLEKEEDSATVSVFYFGKDGGGTIEQNLDRWVNQMSLMDGRNPHDGKISYEKEINGMKVHFLSIFGIYSSSMGGPMTSEKIEKYNYRMVGAIVEAPQGNVFFKLTGPDYTAKIMIEAFISMINSVKKV